MTTSLWQVTFLAKNVYFLGRLIYDQLFLSAEKFVFKSSLDAIASLREH